MSQAGGAVTDDVITAGAAAVNVAAVAAAAPFPSIADGHSVIAAAAAAIFGTWPPSSTIQPPATCGPVTSYNTGCSSSAAAAS